MNLLVSYDWLKEYVHLDESPEVFAARMSLSGPSVEHLIPQGEDLRGIYVGKIQKLEKHPNADKLRICIVDIGREVPQRIVCGGSNLYKNQMVAVAVPGAKVRWHGEGELIELEPTEIRGVASDGMICAANEIGLGDAFPHQDREILDLKKSAKDLKPVPGMLLADLLGLTGDVVMDVEVTSNRPDCMGMVGIAREASAILGGKLGYKEKTLEKIKLDGSSVGNNVRVEIDAPEACSRYIGVRMDGVTVKSSPWWLKRRLLSAGIRPINNLVDITNFVLLETGQPMHVFDAKKIVGSEIRVRFARQGESLLALDGKTYDLPDSVLVIADAKRPIAAAGIMGGEESGATEETREIVLEAATFDPVIIRKGSRKLNLQSDSQLRFEKGLSQMAPEPAMARAIELVRKLAGGRVVQVPEDIQPKSYHSRKYKTTVGEVNALVGIEIPKKQMVDVLKRLGFVVKAEKQTIAVEVPWWRDHDIEDGRDLVEEIARVIGYGDIPAVVPTAVAPRASDAEIVWENRLKDVACSAGYTEIYGYSFCSEDLLKKGGYDAKDLLRVQNPLSRDLEIMRPSLLPQMLDAIAQNQERASALRLFECSRVYVCPKRCAGSWTDLPDEVPQMIVAITDPEKEPWKEAKGFVEHVLSQYDIKGVRWARISKDDHWHPGRAVQAYKDDVLIATAGEITPKRTEAFKIKSRVGAAVIELRNIIPFAKMRKSYVPPSPYPESERDLALIVGKETEYRDIQLAIERVDDRIISVNWFDTYIGEGVPEGKKSVAMHLTIGSREKTLESKEIDGVLENAILACKEKFGAEPRM